MPILDQTMKAWNMSWVDMGLETRKTCETRQKKYNVQKLQKPSIKEEFKSELKNRFSVLSTQNEDTDIKGILDFRLSP